LLESGYPVCISIKGISFREWSLAEETHMPPRLKIRGIYSTALTKFALDSGLQVVEPSAKVRERFRLEFENSPCDIFINDREDLQGIELKGEADQLCQVLTVMRKEFLDAVIISFGSSEQDDSHAIANLELPGASKKKLDEIRASVLPSLINHHRLKIINADLLDSAESELAKDAGCKAELEQSVMKAMILGPLEKAGMVKLEHVRPSGKSMRPREGTIQKIDGCKIVFKRAFSQGRYDGLNLIIREGDYGLTEFREGDWYVKHRYFSSDRLLIGEYFNINTPVELYPYGARYVDLEVDVIRRAGEKAFEIDREKLGVLVQRGCISEELEGRTLHTADRILRTLNRNDLRK
jgi:hypothetical protein